MIQTKTFTKEVYVSPSARTVASSTWWCFATSNTLQDMNCVDILDEDF